MVLTVNSYFALEQIDLVPGSVWMLDAPKETWILAIEGHAQLGVTKLSPGDAVFAEADHAEIQVGAGGLKALLAYPGPNVNPDALRDHSLIETVRARHPSSRGSPLRGPSGYSRPNNRRMPTWPL